MDNFDDFTPSSKSSSTLASIFGKTSNPSESSSLIYTPKKQPKREVIPQKEPMAESTAPSAKLELILFKSVHAFKLSGGAYQSLGKMGLALLGCQSPPVYQLLLYKTKEDVACKIRINSNHVFTIMDNNYASFYSEDQVNYSVMFDTVLDVEAFAQQYAVIKSALSSELLVQDLLFATGDTIPSDGKILVKVTPHQLIGHQAKPAADEQEIQVNLTNDENLVWVQGLRGMKFGSKRVIILPKDYQGPWKELLEPQGKLLLLVYIPKPRVEEKSEISSSGEESASFKEKGAIIEGALAGKSQKSGLLSRVARLGQATLPLKGAVAADMTDSEDDSSPSPKPRPRIKPPIASLRELPLRPIEKPVESVAVYQPQYPPQILNPGYGTLVATTPSSLLSPLDSSLSAHFSESRTQAAELRMNLSKVSDKVDIVINKLDQVSNSRPQNVIYGQPADGAGILASVQALVEENKKLKDKVEEQKNKIDAQSERIYHLLELSHKSLEKSSTAQTTPDDQVLRKNISDLEEKLEKGQNEATSMKVMLETANNSIKNSELEVSELLSKLTTKTSEKNDLERQKNESLEEIERLCSENVKLQQELSDYQRKEDTAELESKCSQLTDELNSMKELALQSENLQAKLSVIMKENNELKVTLEEKDRGLTELKNSKSDSSDTKALMNKVYKKLHSEFQAESQYSGMAIKEVLASVIKELTLEFLEQPTVDAQPKLDLKSEQVSSPSAQIVSPLPSTAVTPQSTDPVSPTLNKLDQENQITYNQAWQTNEPPPLPTFDEEDENAWC